MEAANTERNELRATIITLTEQVEKEKKRAKDLWRINCAQLAEFDSTLALKEDEVEVLQRELSGLRLHSTSPIDTEHMAHPLTHSSQALTAVPTRRRGKAPPIDAFTGEYPETRFDDWLPSLRRAAEWNAWEPDELLLQLAGHLRGRALQEYNLLDSSTPRIFDDVVEALQARLDPGGKAMAAQDFRHASQGKGESVSDFVRRLERIFRVAYGRDGMLSQTRDALLYSQLQEGLRQSLMEAPAVSGATDYNSLCVAAKNEERRQAALRTRKGY